jgi:hypothetical protein
MSETARLIFNHSQHIHGDASADFVWGDNRAHASVRFLL